MSKELTLTHLLAPWVSLSHQVGNDVAIQRLELDSRKIKTGSTFVAIKGHTVDGRQFIHAAIKQGANAIIAEADEQNVHGKVEQLEGVPVVYIADLNQNLSQLASRLATTQP